VVNRKKVQRLWREEGLRVPPKRRKRQRLGDSTTTPRERLRAERPDHVWALDYQFDITATGRTIKILHVVDEFTPRVPRRSRRALHRRGRHGRLSRQDRRPPRPAPRIHPLRQRPRAHANALRDWCRFAGTGISYIEPGSPWENPWVESYRSRMRDELLARSW
jgi:putative transposase